MSEKTTSSTEELGVRIPKPAKQQQIFGIIAEDEDFRFGRIKIERDRQRYTLAAPTDEDEDAIKSVKSFYGVIPYFRKAFFKDRNNEKADKIEKREVAIVRCGKYVPELLYISYAGFWNWKGFLAALEKQDLHYSQVLVKFTAEPGQSKDGQYKFSKPKMEIVRALTEDEWSYIQELSSVVRTRVKKYSSTDELDAAEDKFLDEDDKPKPTPAEEDDDAIAAKAAKRTRTIVDNDEEEEEPEETTAKPPKSKKAEEKPAEKPKGKSVEEDDPEEEEEEAPPPPKSTKKKTEKPAEKEEEPAAKGKGSFPDLEDDEEEALTSKRGKSVEEEEEEEE